MMRSIILFSLLVMGSFSLYGEVHFNLRFTDPDGTGFNDFKNAWIKEAVEEGTEALGKCIKQNAFVTVEVCLSKQPDYLFGIADHSIAHSEVITDKEFNKSITKAMNKILKESNEEFNGVWEGRIKFNIDKVVQMGLDSRTIKAVTIHELTHALGFIKGFADNPNTVTNPDYSDFTRLITDLKGNPLIEDLPNNFKYNSNFDFKSNVYACGPNIKKRNDEKCVRLYNPINYSPGSSFSHLDLNTYPRNLLGPAQRDNQYGHWNKYEIGIMEDLGYEIDWKNYCPSVEEEYLRDSHTLKINIDGLEGANCYCILKNNHKDFPEECFNNEIFYESFVSKVLRNFELQLFVNEEKVWELYSIYDLKNLTKAIHVSDKYYEMKIEREIENGVRTANINFIEIPSEQYCQFVQKEHEDDYSNLAINMDGLKGTNCHFVLEDNQENLPKECFANSGIFDESFIAQVSFDFKLQLFANEEKVWELTASELPRMQIHVFDKDYDVEVEFVGKTRTAKISFTEITDQSTC